MIMKIYFVLLLLLFSTSSVWGRKTFDPFVRGLLRFENQKYGYDNSFIKKDKSHNQKFKIDDDFSEFKSRQGFSHGFNLSYYRVEGLITTIPTQEAVIHLPSPIENISPLYWSKAKKRFLLKVQLGDNLESIAKDLHMSVQDIRIMNPLLNEQNLPEGDYIYVSTYSNSALTHRVRAGETLTALSMIYHVPIKEIQKNNPPKHPKNWIITGQKLYIRSHSITDVVMNNLQYAPQGRHIKKVRNSDKIRQPIARKNYVRLGKFTEQFEAVQFAKEFYESAKFLIDADFIIRLEAMKYKKEQEAVYFVDLGPFKSELHAKSYCVVLTEKKFSCETVKRVLGFERKNSFDSRAILSVSPKVFYEGVINPDDVDIEKMKKMRHHIKEGETVGVLGGVVVKVSDKEIIVVNNLNTVLSLPINNFPEVDREQRLRVKQEEFKNNVNTVVGAAAEAIPLEGEVLNLYEPKIVDRLITGESVRRQGSAPKANVEQK